MNASFLEAAAACTDFDLCSQISGLIEDRHGYPILPATDLPQEMRCVWTILSASGFICKEGLARFLEMEADRKGLMDAYQIIGMPEQAEILGLFVPHLPATEWVELTKSSLCERCGLTLEQLEAAESKFFEREKDVVKNLAGYIRSRLEKFESLPLQKPEWPFSPNIAFLGSLHAWIRTFATRNDGRIPTFPELQEMTLHGGLKNAPPGVYTILLQGDWENHAPDSSLARYTLPILSRYYFVTVSGKIRHE